MVPFRSRTARLAAGHAVAVLVAAAIGALLFFYRFNALTGSLGGFENDEFVHLLRSDLILRGQQPLRDFVDFELRGAWPSLSYEVPAWAQRVWGPTLLAEAYLTAGALAICTGASWLLARHAARWWPAAIAAAAAVFVSGPKPYNYSKVLVLTLAVAALAAVAARPTTLRLAILAIVTAVAALYRHDYGVYVGLAGVAALLAHPAAWSARVKRAALYAGVTAVCLLPSAIWVQRYEGIPSYIASSFDSARVESRTRNLHEWPAIDPAAPLAEASLMAFVYYACWTAPIAAAAVLLITGRGPDANGARRSLGWGLVVLTLAVNVFFLRSNLDSRFGDAMVAVAVTTAWIAGSAAAFRMPAARALARALPTAGLLLVTLALVKVNLIARELETAGLTVSPAATADRFRHVRESLRALPPAVWTGEQAVGTLAAARYLAECTRPDDHVLVGDYAAEVLVYARRAFAGGQATTALGFYKSEADQRRFLTRFAEQSVPVVLTAADYDEVFATDYPLIASHLAARYRRAGTIAVAGEPRFLVFVEADRQPSGSHEPLGLPCYR